MKIKEYTFLLLAMVITVFMVACTSEQDQSESDNLSDATNNEVTETNQEDEEPTEPEEPAEPEEVTTSISIAAIGDMLIHNSVYEDAQTADGYDFSPMLKRVKPFLEDATITLANQETMIGGVEIGLSSYPRFNSPHEVGDALRDAGVDVVTLANNHTLDRGEEAILSALDYWDKINMMYTGAYRNQDDSQEIRVLETDENIDVAFLSYTYGTNGIPVPEGKDYLVNLIDREKIAADIEASKKLADIVVLSLHFGNEYERMPNQEQKDLVQFAADHGAHIVFGHHPHVLQPVDWVEGQNGNQTFVIYSLGNFLSGQDEFYRQIGGMVKINIEKTTKGQLETIEIKEPQFLPTYVRYKNWRDYSIIPMYQLTNEELPDAKTHYEEIKNHMSQWIPELQFIEE